MERIIVDANDVSLAIADKLKTLLKQGSVTWFVSGGSNIRHQTKTMNILSNTTDTSKLTILMIDERYGTVGHDDSNWAQLRTNGFMIDGPRYIDPFTKSETTLDQAVARYERIIQSVFDSGEYTFAQLGMGADGHVSGILPSSKAAYVNDRLVAGYVHEPYERLTTTFKALKKLDEVALVAFGEDKKPQLDRLEQAIDVVEQPAQILKEIPRVTIYTR